MKMIFLLVAAAIATAASAETPVVVESDTRSIVRVSYADLNLSSPLGRERLHDRVTAAVRAMCQDDNVDSLKIELAERRCYAESIRAAGEQIDRALKARSIGFASGTDSIGMVRR